MLKNEPTLAIGGVSEHCEVCPLSVYRSPGDVEEHILCIENVTVDSGGVDYVHDLGDLYTESGHTLDGSFSSVSRPPIARVGAFFTVFRDLQDCHSFAPLRIQNFSKNLPKFFHNFTDFLQNFAKFRSKFG